MRLAQGPRRSDAGESWTLSLESSTLPLSLCAPFLTWYIPLNNSYIKWKNNVMATGCIILIQRSYVNNNVNFLWNKPALVSWSTSELRVRLAPLNRFKPSSKIFYWPFQGSTSFVDLLCFCSVLCLLCFVRVCLYVLCGHLLGKGWPLGSRLWCLLWVCHFPIGILGQVWYLIVSIPDLCNLITLEVLISQ